MNETQLRASIQKKLNGINQEMRGLGHQPSSNSAGYYERLAADNADLQKADFAALSKGLEEETSVEVALENTILLDSSLRNKTTWPSAAEYLARLPEEFANITAVELQHALLPTDPSVGVVIGLDLGELNGEIGLPASDSPSSISLFAHLVPRGTSSTALVMTEASRVRTQSIRAIKVRLTTLQGQTVPSDSAFAQKDHIIVLKISRAFSAPRDDAQRRSLLTKSI